MRWRIVGKNRFDVDGCCWEVVRELSELRDLILVLITVLTTAVDF